MRWWEVRWGSEVVGGEVWGGGEVVLPNVDNGWCYIAEPS